MEDSPSWEEIRAACELDTFNEVTKQIKKLYVAIVTDDCIGCESFKTKIKQANVPYPIVEIPGDICFEIADNFQVRMVPSVILLENGRVKNKHVGSADQIIEKMERGL